MQTHAALAGKLLMTDLLGPELTPAESEFLAESGIRAICLFRRNLQTPPQAQRLLRQLRDVLGDAALIAVDFEGGAVNRAGFLPMAPSAMALGAADDVELTRAVGMAVGDSLCTLGINWNFAPVLDLNCNPQNPVIAERSFGADPAHTLPLALAWLDGLQSAGVAGCIKHFPGHGDTHVDSHRAMPVVDKPLSVLQGYEFAPFRAALPCAASLMSAHIVYSALDDTLPATLSRRLLSGLLREEWGWQGVTITDGMNMQAIEAGWGQARGCAMALAAGADMALQLGGMTVARQAIAEISLALEEDRLQLAQAQASMARLDDLARRFPLAANGEAVPASASSSLMQRAWAQGLTASGAVQRPALGSRVRLVIRADAPSDGVSESGLRAETLAQLLAPLYQLEVVQFTAPETLDWATLTQDGHFNILASTTRRRYGERERCGWLPDLHLVLWNPYVAQDIAAPALISYGFAAPALQAVIDWLKGEAEACGRFPG